MKMDCKNNKDQELECKYNLTVFYQENGPLCQQAGCILCSHLCVGPTWEDIEGWDGICTKWPCNDNYPMAKAADIPGVIFDRIQCKICTWKYKNQCEARQNHEKETHNHNPLTFIAGARLNLER